jgi:hypothetical protein
MAAPLGSPSLEIRRIPTEEHDIRQRALMKVGVVPKHPTVSIYCGAAGSGKTNLCMNLLTNPLMYGPSTEGVPKGRPPRPYFQECYLFIGSSDALWEQAADKGQITQIFPDPTIDEVAGVIGAQEAKIAKAGAVSKAPRILLIFDDVANDLKLLNSGPMLYLFTKCRHLNASVWFLSQYLNLVPKRCRMQAAYTTLFGMTAGELEIVKDQYCPANVNPRDFADLVTDATVPDEKNPKPFLLIDKFAPAEKRFRRNLDAYIQLPGGKRPEPLDMAEFQHILDENAVAAEKEHPMRAPPEAVHVARVPTGGRSLFSAAVENGSGAAMFGKPIKFTPMGPPKAKAPTPKPRRGRR